MLKKKELLTSGLCAAAVAIGIFTYLHIYKRNNTVLPIIEAPAPTLRRVSALVDQIDLSIISLSREMISTLRYRTFIDFFSGGLVPRGLAAPQVGVLKRIFVCGINGEIKVMVNPEIIARKGTYFSHEGCLSLQEGDRTTVKRSAYVELQYKDLDNKARILVARNRNAALLEHEIDHLNGMFNTDY